MQRYSSAGEEDSDFESDEFAGSADEIDESQASPVQSRGESLTWIHMERFTVEEAQEDIGNRLAFAVKGRVHDTKEGVKRYLYCAWHTRDCKKQWLYFYPKDCSDVFLRENSMGHNHDIEIARPPKLVGLQGEVRTILGRAG
jgi:hypothetical protein